MVKRIVLLGLAAVAVIMTVSCTPPETPTHFNITGHFYDGMNGKPVPNAVLRYGSAIGTSGADGAFSVDIGTTAGVHNEDMGFNAPGYTFWIIDPARLDTADTNDVAIRLKPLSKALYSMKDIRVNIYDTVGTEITDSTNVIIAILPRNGIVQAFQATSYNGGGYYSFPVNAHSTDCLVLLWITRPDPNQSFFMHRIGVNLETSEPISLRFDQPLASAYSPIAMTADSTDCSASGQFITPYGLLPVLFTYIDDSGPTRVFNSSVEFSDGVTESVDIYDPDGWQCFFVQQGQDTGYVGGSDYKNLMSTTAFAAVSTTLTLPALNSGLGPSADADLTSWQYNNATGSISIDAVADTQLYQFQVLDQFSSSAINYGIIISFSNSLVLPAWANAIVGEDSPRTMLMIPMQTDLTAYDLEFINRDTYPVSTHFGALQLTSAIPLNKQFNF
jgi:hypothetical protein